MLTRSRPGDVGAGSGIAVGGGDGVDVEGGTVGRGDDVGVPEIDGKTQATVKSKIKEINSFIFCIL